jgi:hypothetical protein
MRLSTRFATLSGLVSAALLCCLLAFPLAASAAPSPWWQLVTGSRPTNLWEPEDNLQEINVEVGKIEGAAATAAKIVVGGKALGCLGVDDPGGKGKEICAKYGFPLAETAAQLQAALEQTLGPEVEVTGGPATVEPFEVRVPEISAPKVGFAQDPPYTAAGHFATKILAEGGSGRISIIATNIGDATMDSGKKALTITDQLPAGIEATGVEAIAGGTAPGVGPVDCEVKAPEFVSCSFKGQLAPFNSIEVEIPVKLTGEPPTQSPPGEVSVAGGNAAAKTLEQDLRVSPDPTPFGIEQFSSRVEEEGGAPATRAGGHPFQLTTTLQFNSGRMKPSEDRNQRAVEQPAQPRNFRFPLPVGFLGNIATLPTCSLTDFGTEAAETTNSCPDEAAIGAASVSFFLAGAIGFARPAVPVFNLPPAVGEPARFGFTIANVPIVIDTEVDPDHEYQVIATVNNASQVPEALGATLAIWGTPGDPRHDNSRGWGCVYNIGDPGICRRPPGLGEDAFLRMPVSCSTPMDFGVEVEPWNVPFGTGIAEAGLLGSLMSGCNQVPFDPAVLAAPTSKLAGSPSGLDFQLEMPNSGLLNKDAIAEGQAETIEVTLPEGMTVNPSQAEGLVGCSPADLARERYDSAPGEGCPEASKVGEVQIQTPILKEEARGSLYVATPFDNPYDALIALYMVARIPERGIVVKQAGVVEADSRTGQLTSAFEGLPQIPVSGVKLHLRSGARSSLVTPPTCGRYDVVAEFLPWSAPNLEEPGAEEFITRTASFEIERGVNGGACPSGATPPFHPGLNAGTINNAAKSYSPFNLRLTRNDGEQEFTNFSIKLPPGVIGKLAGVDVCSDAGIAAATARTGPNGAQEEIDRPSCPANSLVGRTLVGSGVGASLTYVPGEVYMAGPYNGAKLSVVAITPAKVGPFDLGTVVVRQALKVNSETAEVFVDATGSDPLPHIIEGIEVHLRDIRVYVDRPDFVLNPTNCDRTSTASTVLGSGLDFASAADNEPVTVTSPFQAADCSSLGFKPKLSLRLLGGTKRGATPRLKAVLEARKGDANIGKARVTLPHSAFLEQSHIRTVCTRVQFNSGAGNGEGCPKGSIYGKAKAITPLLDEPLQGNVYLRSSNHELPDLVAALHSSKADINLVGRIDSLNGRIRNTFEGVPDAPVTKFVLEMQGGKKGLIVNSTDICKGKHRAIAAFTGQNGKLHEFKPAVKAKCGGKKARKGKSRVR